MYVCSYFIFEVRQNYFERLSLFLFISSYNCIIDWCRNYKVVHLGKWIGLETTSRKVTMGHSFCRPVLWTCCRGVSWLWKLFSLIRGIFWASLPVEWPVVTLSDQWYGHLVWHSFRSCCYKSEVDWYSRSWVMVFCVLMCKGVWNSRSDRWSTYLGIGRLRR